MAEQNTPQQRRLEAAQWRDTYAPEIVGRSGALLDALEMAARVASFDCPVLITGESGTGKELLARALHRGSSRDAQPFVPVNCPAIPSELVESELFGHSKGAFTGATASRIGRFAAADSGTLFLDEIGEMDLNIQSKLLRVLQDFEITPVGEARSRSVDVRVVAATNRDLEGMAEEGGFRADLFYRLNVVEIHLPPLRERREDIPLLIDELMAGNAKRLGVEAPTLSTEARSAMTAFDWPGNIRQLNNTVERLVILRRGQTVELSDLPQRIRPGGGLRAVCTGPVAVPQTLPEDGIDLRAALVEMESNMIRQALLAAGGNKNQAAKLLGLNRTTLVEKLRKLPELAAVA